MNYEKEFGLRLSRLRLRKGISARDMSLSLGQNSGYINSIERGKAFPTMSSFFSICDFLDVSPMEFFSFHSQQPAEIQRLSRYLTLLNDRQMKEITGIVEDLARLNQNRPARSRK